MSAAAANAIDDGWVLDEEPAAPTFATATIDDGWCLDDEPVEAPAPVLTIVADYEDELEADLEIVEATGDGWAISDEEAAFFAAGEALATQRTETEDFSDLGATEPPPGFFKRLFARTK